MGSNCRPFRNFCKFSNSTSQSYAYALFELAKEKSELDKVEDGINGLKILLNKSSDFNEMILNPVLLKEEKNKVILKISEQYNFCETLNRSLGAEILE